MVADTLSRQPLPHPVDEDEEVEAYVSSVTTGWPVTDERLDEIKRAT